MVGALKILLTLFTTVKTAILNSGKGILAKALLIIVWESATKMGKTARGIKNFIKMW